MSAILILRAPVTGGCCGCALGNTVSSVWYRVVVEGVERFGCSNPELPDSFSVSPMRGT